MTNVAKFREKNKAEFQSRYGTKLTYMPFIFQAVTRAIRKFPIFNGQLSGDQIIYKRDINLGMAVALDWGLIVPVIKRADDLSISGLARAANDLADRARTKQLKPDEVSGGTFSITNQRGCSSSTSRANANNIRFRLSSPISVANSFHGPSFTGTAPIPCIFAVKRQAGPGASVSSIFCPFVSSISQPRS